jgi:hypothetical protein
VREEVKAPSLPGVSECGAQATGGLHIGTTAALGQALPSVGGSKDAIRVSGNPPILSERSKVRTLTSRREIKRWKQFPHPAQLAPPRPSQLRPFLRRVSARAESFYDALVTAKIVAKTDFDRAVEIAAEEIVVRLSIGDRPSLDNVRYKSK